ncbi:hypothetical protein AB0G83_31490 [Streptomyces klenkii]|uniref:hypothetical protein n=1 Tax=Streptomyces klenkii TaxID=1420899 RepID=UPI0033FED005
MVEDLRHDTAAESLGFVHTPSLAQAVSTALLRNGRLANRGDDGAVFDLQITSERVRRGRWLLQGVAHGQRLAALLGYRIERRLREAGLTMMRYQMPLRRTAPLRGPDVTPTEPVEVLAARDVVDGVSLLDRWRQGPDAVLDDIARQAGAASSASLPADDSAQLRKVIDDVYGDYDAVSDLLVAESVHQAALGNLERSGAALSAHDRHDRAPGLDYIASPQSGHTVAHRVAVILQDTALGTGWPRDARGAAEPMLDAWIAQVLGDPSQWLFDARLKAPDGTETALAPVSLADLGIGPLSVALAAQKPGEGRPSELQQRIGLAFAAQTAAGPSMELELLADPPSAAATGGLALLTTLGAWVAKVAAAPPLTAGDFVSGTDARGSAAAPGSIGVVAHAWQPFNPARPFAGLVVDGWTETIPADTETTAVTFHYDAPGARAPQALLLAVHPARAPEKWSFELLLDTVNEAADLARLRTLSSKELAPMGSFLPALYLPDDYTRDVPSVSLDDLKEKAKVMATAAGSDSPYPSVLGKG